MPQKPNTPAGTALAHGHTRPPLHAIHPVFTGLENSAAVINHKPPSTTTQGTKKTPHERTADYLHYFRTPYLSPPSYATDRPNDLSIRHFTHRAHLADPRSAGLPPKSHLLHCCDSDTPLLPILRARSRTLLAHSRPSMHHHNHFALPCFSTACPLLPSRHQKP